jgi:eukaryotic-like serine/threonine-protein kinase
MLGPDEGTIIADRFQVVREVGRGAVGIVYYALDLVTENHVALKIIATPGVDAGEEARFAREGAVLAGLRHSGIVRLVSFGQTDDSRPYVAMEWVEGDDLAACLRRKLFSLDEVLEIGAQVADALHAAHQHGIVHRDVKPSNILLRRNTDSPEVKLADFGVAVADDARLTKTGAIIGTPAYMAPEQARGDEQVDARADIYALGATLFELIIGRPPHLGPTPVAVLARLVTTQAPRLSELGAIVPHEVDSLVARMLARSPEDRPEDAGSLAVSLRAMAELSSASQRAVESDAAPSSTGSLILNSSLRPGATGGSRLVTTILATHVPKGDARQRLLSHMRTRGAETTELGGNAVVAHLGVQKALGDEAAQAVDLALRLSKIGASVGIATGRTRVDRARHTGEVVDRAAALSRDAEPGSVLVDATTSELLRGRFDVQLRPDGSAVVGQETIARKDGIGGAPFVGRDGELMQLTQAFERSLEDLRPAGAVITGTSGIGKTRLTRELLASVGANQRAPRVVVLRGDAFSKARALHLLSDLARVLLLDGGQVAVGITSSECEVRLQAAFAGRASGQLELNLPVLARFVANEPLGEQGSVLRDAIWLGMTELVKAKSAGTALVLAVEDAHAIDPESLTWLDHVLARLEGCAIFLVLTARPTFWRDEPNRFLGRDLTRVDLRPLAQRSIRAIATAMLGNKAEGEAGQRIVESVVTQAAGSPLFAEELSRMSAAGREAVSAPTIEAAIQVQLDALDDGAREAALRLSVFGQTGWDVGLQSLGVQNAHDSLRALSAAEIIIERSSSRFAKAREFAFKHSLTRDVAYAAVGEEGLRELHERAAEWLASVGEDDAVVARHFDLAGAPARGASYLERAAKRALDANSLVQAVSFAERALSYANDKPTSFARASILDEAWSRLDPKASERENAVRELAESIHDSASEIRAKSARARYEDAVGAGADATHNLQEVVQLARTAGLVDVEAACSAALGARLAFAGDLDQAQQISEQLLALAQDHRLPVAVVDTWQTLAVVRQTRGDVGGALAARRAAIDVASQSGLINREATLRVNVGFALTTIGARHEARESILSGLSLAQAIGAHGIAGHAQMNLLCWISTFGLDAELDPLLREARKLADNAADGGWIPHDRGTLGVVFYRGVEALRYTGEYTKARSLLRISTAAYRATKMLDVVPVALAFLGDAERLAGDANKARDLAAEAADMIHTGAPCLLNEAPIFLALHDAALALSREAEAKQAIERGVPYLQKRLKSLQGTHYADEFIRTLPSNARMLSLCARYGLDLPS